MKILIIAFILSILWVGFLLYEFYKNRKEYKIVNKFSINNGEMIEYFFVLKRKNNKKLFEVQVNQETYDLHESNDSIIIV